MSILNMSLTGGVFILAVLVLRAAFQNFVPRRTFLVLWLAASALLLIPFRIHAPVSIYALAPRNTAAVSETVVRAAAQPAAIPWWQVIWLAGGVALLLVVLTAHGRNLWRFRKAEPVTPHPAEVPAYVRVKKLPGLPSPLACGIFRPAILIPSEDFATPEQLRHIYLHELCHIRHLDVLRRYLMLLALAVHWFNPLVWVMYYVACQDMEMRCDEQAIGQLGAKKAYATTLVAMETGKLHHMLDAGFSFSSTGSRLKAILKAKRLPVISAVLALVLCLTSLAVFATDAVKQTAPEPPAAAEEAAKPEDAAQQAASRIPAAVPEKAEAEPEEIEPAASQPPEAAAVEPQDATASPSPYGSEASDLPEADQRSETPTAAEPVRHDPDIPEQPSEPYDPEQFDMEHPPVDVDAMAASAESFIKRWQNGYDDTNREDVARANAAPEPNQMQPKPGWSNALPDMTVSYPEPAADDTSVPEP